MGEPLTRRVSQQLVLSPQKVEGRGQPRLLLLDVTRAGSRNVEELLAQFPNEVLRWDSGEERELGPDPDKVSALKAARDIGALSESEFREALVALLPSTPEAREGELLSLLRTAHEGGALPGDLFDNAVSRLPLAAGLQEGQEVEVRDTVSAEWRLATVVKLQAAANVGGTEVWAAEPGGPSQRWALARAPGHSRQKDSEEEIAIERQIRATESELETLRVQRDRLVAAPPLGSASRSLATPVRPGTGRYELCGFAFELAAQAPVCITGVTCGTRAPPGTMLTVYAADLSKQRWALLRDQPRAWNEVAEPVTVENTGRRESGIHIPLRQPVRLGVESNWAFMVHGGNCASAVEYATLPPAACSIVADDGCLRVLAGAAVQRDRRIASGRMGFAFVGIFEYTLDNQPQP
eukprot:Hpha_TRINITY_DN15488_c4_g1::TRINITY_DN15488_c4_g1_i1::g.175634::m.175634